MLGGPCHGCKTTYFASIFEMSSIRPFSTFQIAFERVQKKLFGRGEPDESAIAGDVKTVNDLLAVLDASLAGEEWVACTLSLADFGIATTFMLRNNASLGVDAHPNVTSWIARLEARPGWIKAIAPWRELMATRGVEVK